MIYLDNNATTRPSPEVVDAVLKTLQGNWGNPSSGHTFGRCAREALESARLTVAQAFGVAYPSQVIFTASGTESINLAFTSLLTQDIRQIIISATEHSAVLRSAQRWAAGRTVRVLPVDSNGKVNLDFLYAWIRDARSLVSIGVANNETGVLADMQTISMCCRQAGAILHVDAVQAAGKIPLDFKTLGCDAASLSAHKFHGPPGCGILYAALPTRADALSNALFPGHQEGGLRAGTENLPAIVGSAEAARMIGSTLKSMTDVSRLRDLLETRLLNVIPGAAVHGASVERIPNTSSLFCPNRNASDMVAALSMMGLAVSAGAACSNGASPSHVIQAMGFSPERANSTLRFSLCASTTQDEIREAIELVTKAYAATLPTFA